MRTASGHPESVLTCARSSSAAALLRVRGLTVRYAAASETSHPALLGVGFDVKPGEIVGILGESGSGKSTLALSILGLLPESTHIVGSIFLEGRDLLRLNESERRSVRGAGIAMIFQEPGLSLSPVMRVGDQIAEVLRAHRQQKEQERKQQVVSILRDVGLVQADRVYRAYPHQLSGGELHRVAIAQALACRPNLLIADEPTRSLDGVRQAEVLDLLLDTNRKFGCALVFITHNPELLAGFADRVIVMYGGRIVEEGPISRIFQRPLHPYTKGLLQLVPGSLQNPGPTRGQRLPALAGNLSDSDYLSPGCTFASRCPLRTGICQTEFPPEVEPDEDRRVTCFNYGN